LSGFQAKICFLEAKGGAGLIHVVRKAKEEESEFSYLLTYCPLLPLNLRTYIKREWDKMNKAHLGASQVVRKIMNRIDFVTGELSSKSGSQ
jgi:hypothetical protein